MPRGTGEGVALLEKSFAAYRRKIRGREEEIKKRLQVLWHIITQFIWFFILWDGVGVDACE